MQVDLTTVLAAGSGLLSTLFGAYVGLLKYTVAQRERELDRQLEQLMAESSKLKDRVSEEEKSTIRQDGEIKLVQQTHNDVKADIDEVKRTMVTKAEWEPRMTNMERTLNQVLTELRGISTRYSTHQSGQHVPFKKDPG